MKRVVVTPAGRKPYLDILYEHLKKQRESFDEWVLFVNTNVPRDIECCEHLAATNEWIRTAYAQGSDPSRANLNIHKFLNEFCRSEDSMYLRLDDDISYLAPGFVDTMFRFRERHPEYFLVYANIVNNAIVSWIHQKMGHFRYERQSGYHCTDDIGWKDPEFAKAIHESFLEDPTNPKWTSFDVWIATEYERISVNAICWFGKDITEDDPIGEDEEMWLSVYHPYHIGRPNAVCGKALCVHFAFHTQREHLERCGLLEKYAALAE